MTEDEIKQIKETLDKIVQEKEDEKEQELLGILKLVSPGTPLRSAIDEITVFARGFRDRMHMNESVVSVCPSYYRFQERVSIGKKPAVLAIANYPQYIIIYNSMAHFPSHNSNPSPMPKVLSETKD